MERKSGRYDYSDDTVSIIGAFAEYKSEWEKEAKVSRMRDWLTIILVAITLVVNIVYMVL